MQPAYAKIEYLQLTYTFQAKTYCFCLGFTIAFSALFTKTWRVYRIFTNKTLAKMVRILITSYLWFKVIKIYTCIISKYCKSFIIYMYLEKQLRKIENVLLIMFISIQSPYL